jgi:hypothetical protein
VKVTTRCILALAIGLATVGPADARSPRFSNSYDGLWHLSFVTRTGSCDPSYDFDVNVSNGRHHASQPGSVSGKGCTEWRRPRFGHRPR